MQKILFTGLFYKLVQAKPFTEFILNVEKLTVTNIIEPEIPAKGNDISL